MRGPRILVDIGEAESSRGFHVLAGLSLIAHRLQSAKLYRFSTNSSDERVAARAFDFDTRLQLRHPLEPPWRSFDLLILAVNDFPLRRRSVLVQRVSKRTLIALLFPCDVPPLDETCITVDGHDTAGIGRIVMRELASLSGLQIK